MPTLQASGLSHQSPRWARFALVVGPGLVVMLADTDAGSIITAAQSGAQWGYRLLLLQLVLIPVLFVVQELTVRLGIVSGKGHGELIRDHFGRNGPGFRSAALVLACIGALLSELSGLAGVGIDFRCAGVAHDGRRRMRIDVDGLSPDRICRWSALRWASAHSNWCSCVVAWRAQPQTDAMISGALSIPWHEPKYLYLVAANIGAVIMPWMVFYQQSAVVEKKLTTEDSQRRVGILRSERSSHRSSWPAC